MKIKIIKHIAGHKVGRILNKVDHKAKHLIDIGCAIEIIEEEESTVEPIIDEPIPEQIIDSKYETETEEYVESDVEVEQKPKKTKKKAKKK